MSASETFYLMSSSHRRGVAAVSPDPDQAIPDPSNLLKDRAKPSATIRFHVSWSRQIGDLVTGSDTAFRLLSDRTHTLFLEAGFTGWSSYPAIVRDHRGEHPYHGLQISGRCSPLRWRHAREEFRAPELGDGPKYPVYIGPTIDPGSWDGSDLFMPDDRTTHVLVTDRVRRLVEAHRLTHFEFTPLAEFEMLFRRPG